MSTQKLYDALVQQDLLSINYNEFEQKLSDKNYKMKVHQAIVDNDLYSGDFNTFESQYAPSVSVPDIMSSQNYTTLGGIVEVKGKNKDGTYKFFDQDEEDVVDDLRNFYGNQFNFKQVFKTDRSFNAVEISTKDGKNKAVFDVGFDAGFQSLYDSYYSESELQELKQKYADFGEPGARAAAFIRTTKQGREESLKILSDFVTKHSTVETNVELNKNKVKRREVFEKINAQRDEIVYKQVQELFFDDNNKELDLDQIFLNFDVETPIIESSSTYKKTVQLYQEELNKASEILKAQLEFKGEDREPTKKEIQEKAKQLIIDGIQDKVLTDLIEGEDNFEKVGNFMISTKELYELASYEFSKDISLDIEKVDHYVHELQFGKERTEYENLDNKIKDSNYEFKYLEDEDLMQLEDGRVIPARIVKKYKELGNSLNGKREVIIKLQKDIQKRAAELEDNERAQDIARRNYNGLEEFLVETSLGLVEQFAINIPYGINTLLTGKNEELATETLKVKAAIQKTRDSYSKDVEFDDAFSSVGNFFSFAAQELSNQIPIFIALAMPGGSAMIGVSAFGEQYANLVEEERTPGGRRLSDAARYFNALGYGASELVFERLTTLPLIRAAKAGYLADDAFFLSTGEYFRGNIGRFGYGALSEPIGEGATQITQNLIDGRPFNENLNHAMFSGLMFGTTLSSIPFAKGMYVASLNSKPEMVQVRKRVNEMVNLQRKNNILRSNLALKSKPEQDRINQQIKDNEARAEELFKQNQESFKKANNRVKNISQEALFHYFSAAQQRANIQNEARKIENNTALTRQEKAQRKQELKNKFDYITKQMDFFRNEKTFGSPFAAFLANQDNKQESERIFEQAEADLEARGVKNASEDQIFNEARIIYNSEKIRKDHGKNNSAGSNVELFETVNEANDFIDEVTNKRIQQLEKLGEKNNVDYSNQIQQLKEQADAYKQGLKNGNHGATINLNFEGLVGRPVNNVALQVVENAAKDDRLEIKTHEGGHDTFIKTLGANPDSYTDLSNAIIDYLQKNNKEAYNRVAFKVGEEARPDEIVMTFLEEVAGEKINLKRGNAGGLFGFLLNRGIEANNGAPVDFKGEPDAINFLVNIAKKIKDGTINNEDLRAIKENPLIKQAKEEAKETSKKAPAFSETRSKENLKKIQEAPTYNPSSPVLANEIPGMVMAQISNYFAARPSLKADPESRRELQAEIIARLYTPSRTGRSDVSGFDGRGTLYGYINGRIRYRMLDAFRDNPTIVPNLTQKQIDEELNNLNKELDDTTDLDEVLAEGAENITKVNVLQIGKISSKQNDIINTVKVKEGDTFREVIDNNDGDIGNIIFDIPANKISNAQDNITTEDTFVDNNGKELSKAQLKAGQTGIPVRSEAKKIQDFFKPINAAKNFIRILPETNVTEKDADVNKLGENIDVQREVYGRAIGMPNLILEYFYNKKFNPNGKRARSQGKTSQVALWELKPEFKNLTDEQLTKAAEQFQSDLGIGEQSIPRSGKVKSGQFVKGAAVVMSQQASLSAAQRVLEKGRAPKIQVASVTAAQSKVAFSETRRIKTEQLLEVNISPNFEGDVRNVNSLLKDFIKKGKYKFDSEASVNQFYEDVENVLISSLPKGYITKRILRPSSRVLGVNRDKQIVVNGKKMTIDQYYTKKRNELLSKKDLKYGAPFTGKAAKFKPQRYGDVFGNSAKEFEKANRDGRIKEFNEVNASMHRQLWQRVNESIKDNRENARIWGSYFSTVSLITEHPHRLGAEFVGWSPKPKGYKGKKYEWEHAMPASQSYLYLLESILDPNFTFETSYELVMDNYKLVALDNFVDKTSIKNAGRTTSMGPNWSIITDSWLDRYFKGNINIDPTTIVGLDGKNFSQIYGIPVLKNDVSKNKTISRATFNSRTVNESRGITVLDFDDTLATTESLVKYTAPDGTTGTLNAEQFASTYQDLQDQGYVFDFSDFNRVVKGKLAPLFNKALKLQKKFGPENMFVLTARPPAAQKPIFDFLKANGLNIPLKNITGLGNSTSEAKALWIADKVGEGYNDFYFADDALQNVQAVKNVLDQMDVKSKVQQAKLNFSQTMSNDFNDILQDITGIDSNKRYSQAKARKRGKGKGRFRFFIPPSHEDFVGLLYNFIGKGEKGNKHRDFFEKALIKPLDRAYQELTAAKQAIANDYKNLVKQMPDVRKKLTKKIPNGDYYYEDAIRVYLWNKNGFDIPGMSKTDIKELTDLVNADPKLKSFADTIGLISRLDEGYVEPGEHWEASSIKQDLADATGRVGRGKFFAEFIQNADIIFDEANLNKIEAAFGLNFREALEDMLARTKTGNNRRASKNKMVNNFLDYLNGSIGATMFFNARSAVLQTLSTINFINFGDNNIFKAAARFADQKQFWKDFSMIFNSDVLKQRRAGGEFRLDANEIATKVGKANTITGKVRAATNHLLSIGFLPTQIADSFAIALGGASYYRNRVNTYLKQGLSQTEAESKAFTDFQGISEETQQSARPDKLSQQQASVLGRLILAFQNTPSQYARLIKKSGLDLINRRKTPPYDSQVRSDMSNISRIIYYAAVQNVIFSALQNALFAMLFSEDDEEDEKTKKFFDTKKDRIINGTIDTLLRGSGVGGAIISVLKNAVIKYGQEQEKGWGKKLGVISDEVMQLSPPIGIKLRKLDSFERTMEFNKKVIDKMDTFDINNPMWRAYAQLVEGATNIPVARLFRKVENINAALDAENQWWQRVAVALGWSKWDVGIENKEVEAVKKQLKEDNKKTKTRGRTRRGRKR